MQRPTPEEPDSPDTWSSFAMKWLGVFPYIPHAEAPTECAWVPGTSTDDFSSGYIEAEEPFRREIENTIRQMASGGAASPSAAAAYFLGIRGDVVQQFLFSLDVSRAGLHHTIIPFPRRDVLGIMQWLMIDWWDGHGPELAALLRLRGMHTKTTN